MMPLPCDGSSVDLLVAFNLVSYCYCELICKPTLIDFLDRLLSGAGREVYWALVGLYLPA